MELYLLKSAACLAILYSFYKLMLERSSLHQIKRYYLLSSVVIALLFPLITFTTYVEASAVQPTTIQVEPGTFLNLTENPSFLDYLPMVLWSIYFTGLLFFGLKFVLNLNQIRKRINNSIRIKKSDLIHVLLHEAIIPHTFLSYIFFNKRQYQQDEIPVEIVLHEETHAKQKHSLDILFIEILQLVFWFNPLFRLLKKAVRLNHEFLADQAVLQRGIQPAAYQQTLLSLSTSGITQKENHSLLANANTYSFIKKRLTVMRTHTSKRGMWLRSFLLLPLLALMLYGFSDSQQIVLNPTHDAEQTVSQTDKKIILYIKKKQLSLNGEDVSVKNFTSKINAITRNWSEADMKNFKWDIILQNADEGLLKELQNAYTRTRLYKFNPTKSLIPPPPPAPDAPNAPKADKVIKGVNDKDTKIPPPPPPPKAPKVMKGEGYKLPPPPPPPNPDQLKYIQNLVKGGAVFYWGPHEVSADEVIKMFKKNKKFGVDASEFPIVRVGGGS
jgi:beta-lactamase regulating signal transducer with metallopeptidase domain